MLHSPSLRPILAEKTPQVTNSVKSKINFIQTLNVFALTSSEEKTLSYQKKNPPQRDVLLLDNPGDGGAVSQLGLISSAIISKEAGGHGLQVLVAILTSLATVSPLDHRQLALRVLLVGREHRAVPALLKVQRLPGDLAGLHHPLGHEVWRQKRS